MGTSHSPKAKAPKSVSSSKKKDLAEEVDSLTIHGFSKIFAERQTCRRIFWTLLFLFSAVSLISTFVMIIKEYLYRKTYIKEEIRYKNSLALPAMTFCNTNMLSTDGDSQPTFQSLPENCSSLDDWSFKNQINKKYFEMACKLYMANYSEANIGMGMDERFANIKFPKEFSFTPNFWPCFTLNRNSVLRQHWQGELKGLQMILYYDENEHNNDKYFTKPLQDSRNGLFVNFHDPKEYITKFSGIHLSPGHHTRITIQKVIRIRQPGSSGSKCFLEGKEEQSLFKGKYVAETCYLSCLYVALYKACGYVPPIMRVFMPNESYPSKRNLSTTEYEQCQTNFSYSFDRKQCNCKEPCYEEIYKAKATQIIWPMSWQAKMLSPVIAAATGERHGNYSIEEIRQKLIKISIYYDEFSEVVNEESQLYTFLNVVSDIGGHMGLLLGASWISLVEILMLLIDIIAGRWMLKGENKQPGAGATKSCSQAKTI